MIRIIGRYVNKGIINLGQVFVFFGGCVFYSFVPPFYFKNIFAALLNFSMRSIPLIALTAIFTGMVLALQSYNGFGDFATESSVAMVVVMSVTRELAPVLTGLMLAGRMGSSIAAKISLMRFSEQVSALHVFGISPTKYLISPYVVACSIIMPVLVFITDVIGIFGGYIVAVYKLSFNANEFLYNVVDSLDKTDIIFGMIKSVVFGLITVLLSGYFGYYSKTGARGIANATTNAVVFSSIIILILNYIMTLMFFGE